MYTLSKLKTGYALILLVACLCMLPLGANAATFTTDLVVVPTFGGDVELQFTVTQTGGNPLVVDIYRAIGPTAPPLVSIFQNPNRITPGGGIAVTSGVPTTIVNSMNDITNQANGFLAGTTPTNGQSYFYLINVREFTQPDDQSSIVGGTADGTPPGELDPPGPTGFSVSCNDATTTVTIEFTTTEDNVVEGDSNTALNPSSATQIALPLANFQFDYLIF